MTKTTTLQNKTTRPNKRTNPPDRIKEINDVRKLTQEIKRAARNLIATAGKLENVLGKLEIDNVNQNITPHTRYNNLSTNVILNEITQQHKQFETTLQTHHTEP